MKAWLRAHLAAIWAFLMSPTPSSDEEVSGADRVGVLNTGELIVIDGFGRAQIYSSETTSRIHTALSVDFYSSLVGKSTSP